VLQAILDQRQSPTTSGTTLKFVTQKPRLMKRVPRKTRQLLMKSQVTRAAWLTLAVASACSASASALAATAAAPAAVPAAASVAASVTASPTATAKAPNAAPYEDALRRYEARDFAGAAIQLRLALRQDPKMLSANLLLGKVLMAQGEMPAAQGAFESALKLGVDASEVLPLLAETLLLQGRPEDVLGHPRLLPAGLPERSRGELLLIKASAASDLGRDREALALLQQARDLKVDPLRALVFESELQLRAHRGAEARAAAEQALAAEPNNPRALYQLAAVVHAGGDLAAAEAAYGRVLAAKPEHVDALVARAGLRLDQGRREEAAADLAAARKFTQLDPRVAFLEALLAEQAGDSERMRVQLRRVVEVIDRMPLQQLRNRRQWLLLGGQAHYTLGSQGRAIVYLEALATAEPDSPSVRLLAQAYIGAKRVDKAIDVLGSYLKLRPHDRLAVTLLASAHMEQGRPARAAQLMRDALADGEDPALRGMLGVALTRSGQLGPAVQALEAALAADPGHRPAATALVGLYAAAGQGARALVIAQALASRHPAEAAVQQLLGSAWQANGKPAQARTAFERARTLDPRSGAPELDLARLDITERAFEPARKRLDALLLRDPLHLEAMLEMARLMQAQERMAEAANWLQRADDVSGPRLQPGLRLVEFHLAQSRPEAALEPLKRLRNKAPEALAVLLAQARVQLAMGEKRETRSTLARAATLSASDVAALLVIAEAQLQADDAAGAGYSLDKALHTQASHLRARALRADVYLLEGEPAKAEALARGILASDPKSALGPGLMGDLAMSRQQAAQAVDWYRKAQALQASTDNALRLFAASNRVQHASAVAGLREWINSHPADMRSRRALADAQARQGDFAAARDSYAALLKRAPRDAEALNNLAIVQIALNDAAASSATAKQALALQPGAAHIIGTNGWAAFKAGDPERALQLLRDARLRDPTNAGTRYFLAEVLARLGRRTEARSELTAALETGGSNFYYQRPSRDLLATLN
jgi:putative PEP-CTERM system TPR-repeat lipoprotein